MHARIVPALPGLLLAALASAQTQAPLLQSPLQSAPAAATAPPAAAAPAATRTAPDWSPPPATATPAASAPAPAAMTPDPPPAAVVAPAAARALGERPEFTRPTVDVSFGDVGSGEQVRRTVTLQTTGGGEAEFSLYIPNAPGFAITAVRVMGQGATAPSPAFAQAPQPTGRRTRQPADSVARSVAASVTAPPWRVSFAAPAELQVDVVYAPRLDLFNNTAGPKMGVLGGSIRNGDAGGTSASIALRAGFLGLREVNAAVLKPRENPVFVVADSTSPRPEFFVDFDVAAVGAPIDGDLKQAADVPGIRFYGEPVKLPAGASAAVRADGFTAWHHNGGLVPDGVPRSVPIELAWPGGSSRTTVDLVPVPAVKSYQSPMMKNCGVQDAHLLIQYSFNGGKPTSTGQLTLRNNDPLRHAYIFVEGGVGGERICSASGLISHGGFTQQRNPYTCGATVDAYVKMLRGPVEWRCEMLSCAGQSPEQCAQAEKSRRENPELWRRR